MNSVSGCCLKPIETGAKREYPLGGSTWYETVKVDYCTGCGKAVEDVVSVHSCCGLEHCECGEVSA